MAGFRSLVRRLFGDEEEQDPRPSDLPASVPPERPNSLAEANNDFALAMYNALRAAHENLLFSPFSIRAALAMT
jgi:hypothetical protein